MAGTPRAKRARTEPRRVVRKAPKQPEPEQLPSPRPQGSDVPAFAFQLVAAYMYDVSVTRRAATNEDPEEPRFRTAYETRDWPEGSGFIGRLTVEATYRFRDDAMCLIRLSTNGHFAPAAPLQESDDEQFRDRDSAVLIWPYARAHLGELIRMMDLHLPMLPTIDVRRALIELPIEPESDEPA